MPDARHRRKVPYLEGPGTAKGPASGGCHSASAALEWGILRGAAGTEFSPSAYARRMQGKKPSSHPPLAVSPARGACTGGRDDVRGAFTPESWTFCHPAASPDGERPVAPAAELSVCARNIEAFSCAAFQLYAAKDPLHFRTSALVQKEKGSCSV